MTTKYAIYRKMKQNRYHKAFVYISLIDAFQVFCLINKLFPNVYSLGEDIDKTHPFFYEIEFIDSPSWINYRPVRAKLKNIEDFTTSLN